MMGNSGGFQAGIRLDYLLRITGAILANKELESILGSPLDKHVVLLVKDGRFQFNILTPFGEEKKPLKSEEEARARKIVEDIVKANYPGSEGIPEVR